MYMPPGWGLLGRPIQLYTQCTEFGAKLSASCLDGYVFLHRISWDNYNESGDLKQGQLILTIIDK